MFRKKTLTQQLQEIVEQYRKDIHGGLLRPKDIAAWALGKGLWDAPRGSKIDLCAKQLSEAMREEYYTDPQGRKVRKKHALRISQLLPDGTHKQLSLWFDITDPDITTGQVRESFQLRRHQVLGDCHQLKSDLDSYNDNYNKSGTQLMLSFDFREDLAELEQPKEYTPKVAS